MFDLFPSNPPGLQVHSSDHQTSVCTSSRVATQNARLVTGSEKRKTIDFFIGVDLKRLSALWCFEE